MIDLFVSGKRVDVDKGFSTLITFAIDDIKDFGAKNTAFSKTIVIPGTKTNNALFGNIFNINAGNGYNPATANIGINYNAAVSAPAMIFADGMQVFKGVFRILEITVDDGFIEYECAVFGELGGFIMALGNKKIEELDFSAYNHNWTTTAIENSWDKTAILNNTSVWGTGYYYPLIDYGQVSTNKVDFQYKAIRPALFVREYIDKLITGSGYTWECALFDTALFKRLIVPNNQSVMSAYSNIGFDGSLNVRNYNIADTFVDLIIGTQTTLGNFTANFDETVFTYNSTISMDASMRVIVNGQIISAANGYIKVFRNGVEVGSQYVGTGGSGGYFGVDITIDPITFSNGDYFEVQFVNSNATFNINITANSTVVITNVSTQLIPISYGEPIDLNAVIPKNYLQKDFISSIIKMFNLMVVEDPMKDKHLIISPWIDYYAGTYVDWTNKIDRSKPMKIKPMSELNSRYYQFKYKKDADYYNDAYSKKYNIEHGSYIYDSQYEFASETKATEIIFSSSVLTQFLGTDKIYPAIYKLSNNNTAEDKIDSNIRIMLAKKITGVTGWNINNGTTSIWFGYNYGYAGHVDDPASPTLDICFGAPLELNYTSSATYTVNNLFNLYYSSYMAEITDKDSRLLTCTIKLDKKDINELDFSKFIYIDGAYYRLNKIIDFNASNEDTCTVELLKVINTTY